MNTWRLWLYHLIVRLIPETRLWNLKAGLLRWCGANVGRNVHISSSAIFVGTGSLVIGDGTWIGAKDLIVSAGRSTISIGANCDLGPQVTLVTGTHQLAPGGDRVAGQGDTESIVIGAGCWLCVRSTVLPGTVLKDKTVLAAGAIALGEYVKGSCLLAGIPADVKKIYL